MEYRRMGLIENHESCVSLTFARVLFEFARDGSVLPCNTLFKRTLHRYKGIYYMLNEVNLAFYNSYTAI